MDKKNSLRRADWIRAGFDALTDSGAQALKAEALARNLKVSKGSFYWHFKTIDHLKRAMIQHWQRHACAAVGAEISRTAQAPPAALSRLLALTDARHGSPFGEPAVEAAIRDWARGEPFVQQAVAEVDARRLQFLAGLLRQHGLELPDAAQRARLFYAAMIGREALGLAGMDNGQGDLKVLLASLLAGQGRPPVD